MTDKEYIKQLEKMVKEHLNPDCYEWFYYDYLPQAPLEIRQAYARATGDTLYLNE